MKNRVFLFYILFFYLFTGIHISAFGVIKPPVPVDISAEKVVIGEDKFYVHIVESGQTLFSISKAYKVSQEVIIKHNPDVIGGLKAGQVLKIPFKDENYEQVELKDRDKYIHHIMKEGETLFSLSRKYGVSVEIIKKHNPEVEYSDIQVNQVIKIPRKKEETFSKDSLDFIFYKVKKKETLYSISSKFNISIPRIKEINDKIKKRGLKYGQIIKIPLEAEDTTASKNTLLADSVLADSIRWIEEVDCDTIHFYPSDDPVNIALLLPYMLEENERYNLPDTVNETGNVEEENSNHEDTDEYKIYPKSVNFLQFYEGALIALHKLKAKDIKINFYTYDTEADSNVVKQLIKKRLLDSMDIIIGPVYSYNFEIVGQFAKKREINIVSPLSNNQYLIKDNPYAFQVNPSSDFKINQACSYITRFTDKNIVMIYSDHIADYDIKKQYTEELKNHFSYEYVKNDTDILFKEVRCFDTTNMSIRHALLQDTKNLIIIPSERETFVNRVMNKLHPYSQNYEIELFGLPIWLRFGSIDMEFFYDLQLTYYTPFYIDFEDHKVKEYIGSYRKYFYTDIHRISSEGYNFSMMGYDITNYFLQAFLKHGKNFRSCISEFNPDLPLQAEYNFKKIKHNSGYENQSIHFIKFDPITFMEKKIEYPFTDSIPEKKELKLPSEW